MKKTILAALILAAITPLSAQGKITAASITTTRQTLIADPDVLWLGETYSIFLLDELNTEKTESPKYLDSMGIKNNQRIHVVPIKNIDLRKKGFLPTAPREFDLSNTLIDKKNILKGLFYKDSNCTEKLLMEDFLKTTVTYDTSLSPDPYSFEGDTEIVLIPMEMDVRDVQSYVAKHLVYYNQRNNTWGTLMEALAPVRSSYDKNGILTARTPLFWIKIDNKNTIQNLNNPDISWARRTTRTFSWTDIKVIKTTKTAAECIDLMVDKIHKNAETEDVRSTQGDLKKLTTEEKTALCPALDSISFTDIINFEVVEQTKENFSGKYVERFRFMQEWYWDNKKNKMMVNTLFFAPVINRYDDIKNFLFREPLFWKTVN